MQPGHPQLWLCISGARNWLRVGTHKQGFLCTCFFLTPPPTHPPHFPTQAFVPQLLSKSDTTKDFTRTQTSFFFFSSLLSSEVHAFFPLRDFLHPNYLYRGKEIYIIKRTKKKQTKKKLIKYYACRATAHIIEFFRSSSL